MPEVTGRPTVFTPQSNAGATWRNLTDITGDDDQRASVTLSNPIDFPALVSETVGANIGTNTAAIASIVIGADDALVVVRLAHDNSHVQNISSVQVAGAEFVKIDGVEQNFATLGDRYAQMGYFDNTFGAIVGVYLVISPSVTGTVEVSHRYNVAGEDIFDSSRLIVYVITKEGNIMVPGDVLVTTGANSIPEANPTLLGPDPDIPNTLHLAGARLVLDNGFPDATSSAPDSGWTETFDEDDAIGSVELQKRSSTIQRTSGWTPADGDAYALMYQVVLQTGHQDSIDLVLTDIPEFANIDAAKTLNGIEVIVSGHTTGTSDQTAIRHIQLWDAGAIGNDKGGATPLLVNGPPDTEHSFGGDADLWGTSLVVADIKDPTFGLLISLQHQDIGQNSWDEAFIDDIRVVANVTGAGGGEPDIHVVKGKETVPNDGTFAMGSFPLCAGRECIFTIQNVGDALLTLTSVTVGAGFTITTAATGTIAAGASKPLGITPDSGKCGSLSALLSIDSDDPDPAEDPYETTLTARIVAPRWLWRTACARLIPRRTCP